MNERLPDMTLNGMSVDVSVSQIYFLKLQKHLIVIRLLLGQLWAELSPSKWQFVLREEFELTGLFHWCLFCYNYFEMLPLIGHAFYH